MAVQGVIGVMVRSADLEDCLRITQIKRIKDVVRVSEMLQPVEKGQVVTLFDCGGGRMAARDPLTGVGREVVPRRGGRLRPLRPAMAAGPTRVCSAGA